MKRVIKHLLFVLAASGANLFGLCEEKCCIDDHGVFSFYTLLSHTEGKGIGYKRGYTSLDFFLMPSLWEDSLFYPFIDFCAHGMNNQKIAANAGIGIRYLSDCCWLFGGNLYYDYRQGQHRGFDQLGYGFQQVGIGFEALGPRFDCRINIYQPVGKKVWRFKQTYFLDDAGIVPTTIYKHQSPMKGFDAEIGGYIGEGCFCGGWLNWSLYLAAGPYYLHQERSKRCWGGKGRLEAYLGRYLYCKVQSSYDHLFKGTLQVCIGVDIPLYPFTSLKPIENYCSPDEACCAWRWRQWMSQPVERAEIMPLCKKLI